MRSAFAASFGFQDPEFYWRPGFGFVSEVGGADRILAAGLTLVNVANLHLVCPPLSYLCFIYISGHITAVMRRVFIQT
jgi:hypothetical protein